MRLTPTCSPSPRASNASHDPDVLALPALRAAAVAAGRSPAQVALRWALQRGTVPLPRTTTLERVAENGDVFSWRLSEAHMAAIDAEDRTRGSAGRIMKGDNFAPPGVDWRSMWDEEEGS